MINVGGVPNTVTADAETGSFSAVVNMSAKANSTSVSVSVQQSKSGTTYAAINGFIGKNSAVITAPTVATTTGGAASAFPLSGTGTAGSIITLVITSGTDTVVLGGIVVDSSGNWSATVNLSTVAAGGITVRVYERLSNGNQSATVTSSTSTIAGVAAPLINALGTVTNANGGASAVILTGGAVEAGAKVYYKVVDASDVVVLAETFTTANGSGAWSATLNLAPLSSGSYSVKAYQVDIYGNISAETTSSFSRVSNVALNNPGNITPGNKFGYAVTGWAIAGASLRVEVGGLSTLVTADAQTGAFYAKLDVSSKFPGVNANVIVQQTFNSLTNAPESVSVAYVTLNLGAPTAVTATGTKASATLSATIPTGTSTAGKITFVITSGAGDFVVKTYNMTAGTPFTVSAVDLSSLTGTTFSVFAYTSSTDGGLQQSTVTTGSESITTEVVKPFDLEEMLDGKSLELWVKAGATPVADLSWTDFMDRPSLSESLARQVDAFESDLNWEV